MRLALITSKIPAGHTVKIGIMPDPTCFPVSVNFENGKLVSIQTLDAFRLGKTPGDKQDMLSTIASITNNLSTLMSKGEVSVGMTADSFATALEERLGRQVVEGAGGKLIAIGKIKEKEEGVKTFVPVISGKKVNDKELTVDAEDEKQASKKMQIRFVTAAAEDKKIALLIGTWLADGCKVEALSVDLPKDFIDLHTIK